MPVRISNEIHVEITGESSGGILEEIIVEIPEWFLEVIPERILKEIVKRILGRIPKKYWDEFQKETREFIKASLNESLEEFWEKSMIFVWLRRSQHASCWGGVIPAAAVRQSWASHASPLFSIVLYSKKKIPEAIPDGMLKWRTKEVLEGIHPREDLLTEFQKNLSEESWRTT